MIGNDIIDLNVAGINSRWKEQRFLDKIFSAEEQDFIRSESDQFQNIWRLWSMKESAYKIMSRSDGIVRFNPKDFKCTVRNFTEGQVIYENTTISTLTELNPNYIQTTAFSNSNWTSRVFPLFHSDVKSQHLEMYQHVIKIYSDLKNVAQTKVDIRKMNAGVPQLYIDGILQKEQLSITHHGRFGAFAIAG